MLFAPHPRSHETPDIVAQFACVIGCGEALEVGVFGTLTNEKIEIPDIPAPAKVKFKRTVRVAFTYETAHEESSLFLDGRSSAIEGLLRNREHGT